MRLNNSSTKSKGFTERAREIIFAIKPDRTGVQFWFELCSRPRPIEQKAPTIADMVEAQNDRPKIRSAREMPLSWLRDQARVFVEEALRCLEANTWAVDLWTIGNGRDIHRRLSSVVFENMEQIRRAEQWLVFVAPLVQLATQSARYVRPN